VVQLLLDHFKEHGMTIQDEDMRLLSRLDAGVDLPKSPSPF
jgi:hypothetical protein